MTLEETLKENSEDNQGKWLGRILVKIVDYLNKPVLKKRIEAGINLLNRGYSLFNY